MADEVEKVGADVNAGSSGGDGGQQPETIENENKASFDPTTADGAPVNDPGSDATGDATTTKPARRKKDDDKLDFPIADAQYRNDAGDVVSAAKDVGEGVLKLVAVPRPVWDDAGEVDEKTGKKPVIYAGWNHRKHKPLKKGDFVDEVQFILYNSFTLRIRAAVLLEKASLAEKRANRLFIFPFQSDCH